MTTSGDAAPPGTAPQRQPGLGSLTVLTICWLLGVFWAVCAVGLWVTPPRGRFVRVDESIDVPGFAGFMVGSAVLPTLVVLAVQSARGRGRKTGTRALQVLVAVAWLGAWSAALRSPRAFGNSTMKQTKAGLQALADTMQHVAPEPGTPRTAPTSTADPAALGDYGLLVAIMQKYIASVQSTAKAYERAVGDLGISTVMVPSNLATAEDRAASKAKLLACATELDRFKANFDEAVRTARDSIQALPLDRKIVSNLRRDFDNGLSRSRPLMERNFAYEGDVLEEMLALLEHLSAVGENVRYNGRSLVFDLDTDKFLYNASVDRIRSIAAREAALEADMQKVMTDARDRLRAAAADPSSLERIGAPPRTKQDAIRIQPDGAVLVNDVPLAWPPTIDSLRDTFGQARTTHQNELTYTVWDDRGVFAISRAETAVVQEVGFLLNINPSADFFPRTANASVSIFGTPVRETATPLSLNRALGERRFRCVNEERAIWGLDLTEDRWIAMFLGDGSCDTIRIVVEAPEAPAPETPKPAASPRF